MPSLFLLTMQVIIAFSKQEKLHYLKASLGHPFVQTERVSLN